jgi:hypothetical protein
VVAGHRASPQCRQICPALISSRCFQGASSGLNYGGTHIDSAEVAGNLEDKTSRSTKSRDKRMAVSMLRDTRHPDPCRRRKLQRRQLCRSQFNGLSTTAFLSGEVGGTENTIDEFHRRTADVS